MNIYDTWKSMAHTVQSQVHKMAHPAGLLMTVDYSILSSCVVSCNAHIKNFKVKIIFRIQQKEKHYLTGHVAQELLGNVCFIINLSCTCICIIVWQDDTFEKGNGENKAYTNIQSFKVPSV